MQQTASPLRITLADIALLTKVQRPVVSMWRSRSKGTDAPFPDSAAVEHGQELFDAGHILEWLAATGRGNNPHAAEDIAAFAFLENLRPRSAKLFDGITSLLTLRRLLGGPVGLMSTDELMDAADETDPDDRFLYTELEALGSDLCSMALYADLLADGAYSTEAAFEKIMGERFRAGIREQSDVALTQDAVDLVAAAAVELADASLQGPVFADLNSGGGDLLMGIVARLDEAAPVTIATGDDDGGAHRLVRRRLHVHGVRRQELRVDDSGGFGLTGPVVHVAQYPAPGRVAMTAEQILSAIEDIALQMDDQQRAVLIGPASVLVDPAPSRELEQLRADLLRLGRLRAAIRLPRGLIKGKPRQAQALWVLGPAHAKVPAAERWTMMADLSGTALSPDVAGDLISDLAASMASLPAIRAHSFRFARLVLTRTLLAGRGALTAARTGAAPSSGLPGPSGADDVVRIERLVNELNAAASQPRTLALSAETAAPGARRAAATIGGAIAAGHLSYRPGNRLDAAHIKHDGGARVLGVPELTGGTAAGTRHIDQLLLASHYASARRTEPGDVVFCTSPAPAAMVDAEGSAVVAYPVRVLRISATDPGGLLPAVLAADINAAGTGDDWRRWPVRTSPDEQRTALTAALIEIETQRAAARSRLGVLDELATLITDGVAGRGLTLSSAQTDHHAPPEGTR